MTIRQIFLIFLMDLNHSDLFFNLWMITFIDSSKFKFVISIKPYHQLAFFLFLSFEYDEIIIDCHFTYDTLI
jgi:hypothetical protein